MPDDNSKYQEPIDDQGPIADNDGADGWYDQGFDVELNDKSSGVDEFGINHDLFRENVNKTEEEVHAHSSISHESSNPNQAQGSKDLKNAENNGATGTSVYHNAFLRNQDLNKSGVSGSKTHQSQPNTIFVGGEGYSRSNKDKDGKSSPLEVGGQYIKPRDKKLQTIEFGGQGRIHTKEVSGYIGGNATHEHFVGSESDHVDSSLSGIDSNHIAVEAGAQSSYIDSSFDHEAHHAHVNHSVMGASLEHASPSPVYVHEEDSFAKAYRDRVRSQDSADSQHVLTESLQDKTLSHHDVDPKAHQEKDLSHLSERERIALSRANRIREADERRRKLIEEQKQEYEKVKRIRQQRMDERNKAILSRAEQDERNQFITAPIAYGQDAPVPEPTHSFKIAKGVPQDVVHHESHEHGRYETEYVDKEHHEGGVEVVKHDSHKHAPKPNSEKSLEELAREYPDVAPENLVKLRRSSNRCHLVSRTPVFDSGSNIAMYELKFTAGKVFQVHALKSEHVYHVLFGYFIRRGVSCFIGRNKQVLVMMPLTYDLVNYIDRYSIARVVLRICPEQPVTPSALHILTRLKRAGMTFAIDLMVLLKKEWSRAIISIEYVMIDLSSKVQEQLNVFKRIKAKAPWLKTIGYNDTNASGYSYLQNHEIDLYDGQYWDVAIEFNQPEELFDEDKAQVLVLIKELFRDEPDYMVFRQFLSTNEAFTRDVAVFLYRFRHASPRQVQNVDELFTFLLDSNADRSFSILAARSIMLTYVRSVNLSSQLILQEHYSQAIIRGYFCEYMARYFDDPFISKYAFQSGMFSLLHLFMLEEEVKAIVDERYADIYDKIYGQDDRMADMIECVQAMENTDLVKIFNFIQKYNIPPASVLVSYEKALMRTNELLLVLHIVTSRK